jgi:carnosine N-methyltransferase
LDSLSKLDDLIDSNAELAEAIFIAGFKEFLAPSLDSDWVAAIVPKKLAHDEYKVCSTVLDYFKVQPTMNDVEKARSCINQFYREWSAEGAVERENSFDPVKRALDEEYESRSKLDTSLEKSAIQVLLPGAGLGRLLFDLSHTGYSVEGNEISYHELMGSSLALNHCQKAGQFRIAPFALNSSNHLSRSDQFQTCLVPDIHPATVLGKELESTRIPASERMSFATGDFCVVYNQPSNREGFDAVATVFFIDTAPNIMRYIEAVRHCLKPGGIWINLGPLLWHHASRTHNSDEDNEEEMNHMHSHAGIADPGSVELTNEEVVALVQHFGFTMEKHETGRLATGYITNPRSMLQNFYRPSFWIARKN